MSWRSLLEFNHDKIPSTFEGAVAWADHLLAYLRGSDPAMLPKGVTFFHCRHHSTDCPMGEPPRGWENDQPRVEPEEWQGKDAWKAPDAIKLQNCRMLMQRMAARLAKHEDDAGDTKLAKQATDYLQRAKLAGSVLR